MVHNLFNYTVRNKVNSLKEDQIKHPKRKFQEQNIYVEKLY